METWKDIKDYEELYQISNMGRVRSLDSWVNSPRGLKFKRGRLLKPTDNGHGYKLIGLSKNGKRRNHYIHRLVANAFVYQPSGCDVINHKDYNRANNRADNLEWVTQRENVLYSLPNKPEITKRTNQFGKYIKKDKRYSGFVVVVGLPDRSRKYLGRFENLQQAIEVRDRFLKSISI